MKTTCVSVFLCTLLITACGTHGSQPTAAQATQQNAQPAAAPSNNQSADASAQWPVPPGYPAAPQPATAQPPAVQPAVEPPPQQAAPASIGLPAGTVFRVRLDQTLDTRHNRPGDRFSASLAQPVVDGRTILLPIGTRCYGHLVTSQPSGRFKGRAVLSLSLDSFDLHGQHFRIATNVDARWSGGHKKRNWVLMGGGTSGGAAIGAIAAGPFGAAVGAGAGGVAGTVGAAITGKKNVRLPAETVLAFSLRRPITL